MRILSRSASKKLVIVGAIIVILGFAGLMVNLFSVYGKASNTFSCPATSNCGLSSNILLNRIGTAAYLVGFVLMVSGGAMLVVGRKHHK